MYNTIKNCSKQFLSGYNLGLSLDEDFPINTLILVGMGGSALPADLVNDYLRGVKSIRIVCDYHLPPNINKESLVFCSSYSGNTEETLSAFDDALSKGAQIVVLTHGGKLKEKALANNIPLVEIPKCVQPRMAAGYFFSAILGVLERCGQISPQKENLQKLSQFLESQKGRQEEIGKRVAQDIVQHVPIVYGPSELYGACRVIKIKFNENCKIQSFFNVFPELNHNEMVGYTKLLMKPVIIYLKGQRMHPRIYRRMEVMEGLLKNKIPFQSIELKGENQLQEMWDAVLIGDYASYYLAKAYGVDPAPVEMVESFKKQLDS